MLQMLWINIFVGEELQAQIPDSNGAFHNYLPDRIEQTFFLMPTTTETVQKEILKLNPKKAPGCDNIGAKILQICPNVFAENLSKIYNHAIEQGEYPTQLKIAEVIALYKKSERYKPNNYRPISLLSCFNKSFEKIICKQILAFLYSNEILYDYQ